jgi:hypothetical protein
MTGAQRAAPDAVADGMGVAPQAAPHAAQAALQPPQAAQPMQGPPVEPPAAAQATSAQRVDYAQRKARAAERMLNAAALAKQSDTTLCCQWPGCSYRAAP